VRVARLIAAALAALLPAAAANTVEIRGKVTNQLAGEKYRQVEIVVTDRLGVELGRARPDTRGRYEMKISGPRYVILKALLEGGVFTKGRIPKGWRTLCQVDRFGLPLPGSPTLESVGLS
jgi:hypothetical protein